MKIRNLLYIAALGMFATSCTDGNDWDVDGAFDRLFGISSSGISVEPADITATVTFDQRKDT